MLGQQVVGRTTSAPARSVAPGWSPGLAIRARTLISERVGRAVVPRVMLAMALLVLGMLVYLQEASQVSVHQYAIADLQLEHQQLSLSNLDLDGQMNQLQSVTRITKIATTQLHMSPANLSNSIWVNITVPAVTPPPAPTSDDARARAASSPLHWMTTSLTWLGGQL